jgi:hypothetical protein
MSRTVVFVLVVVLGAAASALAESKSAEIGGIVSPLPVSAPPENVFERAKAVKTSLSVWSERMHKSLDELKRLESKLDLREIDAQKVVLDDFGTILADVRSEAEALLAARDKFQMDFRLYRQALVQAPSAFEAVAKDFERKAGEESEQSLKEHYVDFAKSAKSLARTYATRVKEIDAQEVQTAKKIVFVERSIRFVDDVHRFLEVIPATNEGVEVQRYIKRINEYIHVFHETFNLLKGTVDKIAEPQPGPSPGEQQRKVPQVSEAIAQPLTFAEYRAGLAALRQ